jgi:hypothetical protein
LRPKNIDWPKLDRFNFLILDILSAWTVSAELQLPMESQSEPMGSSGIQRIIFDGILGRVATTVMLQNKLILMGSRAV